MKRLKAAQRARTRLLLDHYQPLPGVPDEMVDAQGIPRPLWADFVASLEDLGPDELARRFARADQYLRDAGVYYRVYDKVGENEREWPLAHIPLLIEESEWEAIGAGLTQRADLFEAIVADIYGAQTLVADGLMPPGLVASSPEFLRPFVGAKPVSGHFLHFCAFELGRGPNGKWWVLGDRMQAPSGAGFALENRVATTRALSDIAGDLHIRRLAGFFRHFRDALTGSGHDGVAILTPGPLNETYYEHAYIARYLGIMLLEGEDLTVANDRLMVRTVSGLKPIGVLWRRLDAAFADPLELNGASRIGTPGLAQAVREGAVSMVNALGAGILETRAFAAFLPRIAKVLRGEDLLLPSIATWWCGGERERAHVVANLDRMMVGPALSTRLPFEDETATVHGRALDPAQRTALVARIESDGAAFVGQEAVRLSTTPVYAGGRLEPRPAVLRAYLARTPNGWVVMPGGFARLGRTQDTAAIAMQRGGQAADVWIVSKQPVRRDTFLPDADGKARRQAAASLPSRAAENLTWLGRYVERAEDTVRLLRAFHVRLAETGDPDMPLLSDVTKYLKPLGIDTAQTAPRGLLRTIDNAIHSAGQIRDRFSPDGWLALRDLAKTLHNFENRIEAGNDATRAMTVILRKLAGFSGLLHENMVRSTGWRFLEVGRRLERAIQISRTLAYVTRDEAPDGTLDLMLEAGDSVMIHRRHYVGQASKQSVVDLLLFDPLNPRSVLFQLERLKVEIDHLPRDSEYGLSEPAREVLRLRTELDIQDAGDVTEAFLEQLSWDVGGLYDKISAMYFR